MITVPINLTPEIRERLDQARVVMRAMRDGRDPLCSVSEVLGHCRVAEVYGTPLDRLTAATIRREIAIREQIDPEEVKLRRIAQRRRGGLEHSPRAATAAPRASTPAGMFPWREFGAGVLVGICIAHLFF